MKGLRSKTVRAGGWVLGTNAVRQLISIVFGIALARLLVPDDFGLIAMVMVFSGLAGILSNVGLGAALVHKKDVRQEHYNSVFWLNLTMGSILCLALYAISPWLSVFYGRPEVEIICKALSFNLLLGSLGLVPRTIFIKDLAFKYISLSELLAMVASGLLAIVLASIGFGYWSLVIHILFQQFVATVLIWVFSSWRPKIEIRFEALRELFGFSANVFATSLIQYGARNLDKLLLGKFLGGGDLGLYDKALSMMLFPLSNISRTIAAVMFPSLSLIQSDVERVKMIYLRSTATIALVTFPMMTGMFVVAESFTLGVLGEQWAQIIPVLRVFCVAGVASSIVTVTGVLYKSQGAVALQLRVNLVTQPIRVLGVIVGLPWGLLGVTVGFAAATFISSLITLVIAGRLIELRLFTLMRSLVPILLPALLMAVLVWAIRPLLDIESEFLLFMIQAVAGFFIYWGLISALRLKAYHDIATVLREEYLS